MLTPSPHLPLLPLRPQSSSVDGLSYDAIAQTLSEFKPIAFNVNFARITGDAKAALMLSQLMYWTKRGTSVLECDGWIFKTRDQWITEIGLGRHEQSTARQTLIDLGLIEESRIGHPARNCFRIIPQELGNRLAHLLRTETIQWSLLDIRNDAEHVKSMLGRTFAFYCVLVDITNSCTNAIYLSKALTIQKRFAKQVNSNSATLSWSREWFRMAASTTHDETGLTVAQQRKAKESLCELGLLHEAMMEFPRKQIYLRIDIPTLERKLIAALTACQNQPVDKNQVIHSTYSSDAKTSQSNSPFAENRQTHPSVGLPQVDESVEIKGQIDRHTQIARNSTLSDVKTDPPDGQLAHGSRQVLARRTAGFSMLSRQVLAPLHARDATHAGVTTNNDYKEEITTTPTSPPCDDVQIAAPSVVVVDFELIWPETLSDWQRGQCRKILTPLAKTDQQDLLDELAGHLLGGGINNPVSYLGSLVRKHQSTPGGLVFEKLEDTRQRRAVQQQIQAISTADTPPTTTTSPRPDTGPHRAHQGTPVPDYVRQYSQQIPRQIKPLHQRKSHDKSSLSTKGNPMTNELMTVPFHGNNLFITTVNGQPYTPMKPIVEGMGLDWRGQHEKLKANQTRWGMGIIPIPSAGGKQEAVCLPMQKLAGWLMTIQPSRVAPEIRPKIITYQNECDDALWDYWTKGTATRNGTPSQEDEPHTPTIKDFLLLNERMNQLPGAEPTAVMDATLTMIQQNTGIQVDALRRAIPTSTPKIKESINPPPTKAKELRVDGDISPNDIEAWKKFVSQPMHERLLQLHWISRNRSELAVLWTFCEHHRRTATLGEKYFRRDSRRLITSKLSDRIHCTEVGVSKSINALIEEGVLGKQEHVDNVIRKLWLNWPALAQRLKIDFPDQQVLQLNWLAQNTAELGVLSMLTQHWFDSSSMTDGVRTAPFVKVTLKTVQLHCNQLGASTNAKSIERAVTKLSESGLIELSDHGVMNKARISTTCFSAITTFLTTNFENGLW